MREMTVRHSTMQKLHTDTLWLPREMTFGHDCPGSNNTGALLCFSGLALSVDYWGTTLVPVVTAYLWGIGKEDGVLTKAFGVAYQEYCDRTFRLVPGII